MFSSYGRRPGVNSGPSITTSQPSRYITTYGPQRRQQTAAKSQQPAANLPSIPIHSSSFTIISFILPVD
ncbi:conserved hypothetical protein [Aspergillus fumigatus A1163]|uniref:Uncharacterized protein n=1 Tax=Aspergillus fumigatus (strain CBS 144.89 / FGSC A1163 / CEA10) TaxID=451804 RepID=B0XQU5_ASPFC|nr:conserved hypothetical protein [Aspergillus fumigatus A1163]